MAAKKKVSGKKTATVKKKRAAARGAVSGASKRAPVPSISEIRKGVSEWLRNLDQDVPIGATVVFKVKAAEEATFRKNLGALARATRELTGMNVFDYHKRMPQPVTTARPPNPFYLIYEDWESVGLFRKQWDSKHLGRFQSTVGSLLAAQPDLIFYYGAEYDPAAAAPMAPEEIATWLATA